MINKDTERLLINVNHCLRRLRIMARRKYYTPYELCENIIIDTSETLDEIKHFRQAQSPSGVEE